MVFNATFNIISVKSWRSVFYWWRKPENTTRKPPTCLKSMKYFITYRVHLAGFELTTLVVIGTGCIGRC